MSTPDLNSSSRGPMTSPGELEPLGPQFAELLAAYDELLAVGAGVMEQTPAKDIDDELSGAKECLQLLEQVWPRAGGGDGCSPRRISDHVSGVGKDAERPRYLGQFEILHELGRGGGGIVFLAIDSQLGRKVALKVPRPEVLVRRELRERFVQEGQAAARLNHPNIIPVFAAGEIGPVCYIASAYCDGPTLSAWLKERAATVPFDVAARLVADVADAVEHAHSQGILHRDIKPSNVLLEGEAVSYQVSGVRSSREKEAENKESDSPLQAPPSSLRAPLSPLANPQSAIRNPQSPAPSPKLTDFGLAKLQEIERDATRTGAVLGTPTYMAPEQAEGRLADIDVTTDVYGLGVTLYELIAGRPPFQAESELHTLQSIARDDPPLPRQFRRRVPRDLEAICLKCLEKSPSRRYQRAADLAADLRRFLAGQPTIARPVGWIGRALRWSRRRPAAAGILVVSLAATAAAIAGLAWHRGSVHHVTARADERVQRLEAKTREQQRRDDYADNIQGAYHAWQSSDLKTAIELLDRCRPAPNQEDLRGFEWYYVRHLCAGGLATLRGHAGAVQGVAFDPRGQRLASCGADGTLRIWDITPARALSPFAESSEQKGTVPLSHNSLATVSTLQAHQGAANAVAWSPDGVSLATVGDDALVRIWDTETRQPRATLIGANERLLCVAFSPDGRHVAAAGQEPVIRIWSIATGEETQTIRGHSDTIHAVAFSPDGMRLASGSADRTARIWDAQTGSEVTVIKPRGAVLSVAFAPDGRRLATGDAQISLWNVSTGTLMEKMNAHRSQLRSIAFSSDGRTVASASDDLQVCTWNTAALDTPDVDELVQLARDPVHTHRGHTGAVLSVAFSPSGDRLASAGRDGSIQIWDPTKPQDRSPVDLKSSGYCGLAFSSLGTFAVTASSTVRSELLFWNSNTIHSKDGMPIEGTIGDEVEFSPDGNLLAFAGAGGKLNVYDVATDLVRTLATSPAEWTGFAFSPDGKSLAAAADSWNSVKVFDLASGKVSAKAPGQRTVAFSPDGRLLATESSDVREFYPVELWDLAAGKSVGRLLGHKGQITSMALAADGRTLATASADGTARLWDLDMRSERFVLRANQMGVQQVAFLLDDKSLATASIDGTVKIWDAATGRLLLTLDVNESLTGMAVSADGRTLATASRDANSTYQVDLWTAPLE